MTREWKCARCSTKNSDDAFSCGTCGLLRGSAVPAPFLSEPPPAADAGYGVSSSEQVEAEASLLTPEPAPAGSTDEGVQWVEPAAAVPIWRRIPLGLFAGIAIALVVAGAGWYFAAGRSSSGDIEKAGDLAASDLLVGDCFDLKDPAAAETEDVTGLPCGREHEYETFFVGVLPEGPYPTDPDATFTKYVEDNCVPAFGDYVGKTYEESELEIFWFYPVADGWESGDRSVQCAVYHPRIHRLTGSLKGSTR